MGKEGPLSDWSSGLSSLSGNINFADPEVSKFLFLFPEMLCLVSSDGKFVYLNHAWETTLGYSVKEMLNQPFFGFVHPNDLELALKEFSDGLHGKESYNFLNRFRCKDGSYKWFEWRAKATTDRSAIYAIARDISEKKVAQETLLESDALLHGISTAVRDAIIMIGPDGKITFWNEAAVSIFGYSQEEALGKNLHELLVPERYMAGHQQAFPHFVATGKGAAIGKTLELQSCRKGGQEFSIELSLSAINIKGQWHAIGIVKDITERKKTEEAYRQVESRFRSAFELPLFGFAIISPNAGVIEVNNALEEMIGYSKAELEQLRWFDLTHPEDTPKVMAFLEQMRAETIDTFQTEMRIIRKNEDIIWTITSTACVRKDDHSIDYYITTLQDITKRKQAQDAVLRERILLRTLIDNLPDTIYVKDIEGKKVIANQADLNLLGYAKEEEVIGKTDLELLNNEAGTRGYADDMEILKNNKSLVNHEEWFVDADGNERWLYTTKVPLFNEAGKLQGLVGIGRDITQRRNFELQLEQQAAVLKGAIATKDKFFSIIAHDLRSPLSGFMNLAKIMAEDLQDMSLNKIQKFATAMSESASTVFAMLENLLEWSRMQRGMIQFEPENFHLKQPVVHYLNILNSSLVNKDLHFTLDIPDDLEVYADQRMLESIVSNLVSNAIKFTPRGGEICFSARYNQDRSVQLSIRDTGIGMDQALLNKLFRIDENPSRQGTEGESSSGLGLLLCKEFVEKHGGTIWVESQENQGSTFFIRLPAKKPES